jgi:hypothetical protein
LFYNDKKLVDKLHVEFKFGCSQISKLPQILSLSAKTSHLFPESYPEFYYNHFLDSYLELDDNLQHIQKPSLQEYMKYIGQIYYQKHTFFQTLKDCENFKTNEKFQVVNKSIQKYYDTYIGKLDVDELCVKLKKSQTDKIYFLWNNGKFHVDTISIGEVLPDSFRVINNTYIFKTTSGVLIHWRNHKGILNPAYQISIKY